MILLGYSEIGRSMAVADGNLPDNLMSIYAPFRQLREYRLRLDDSIPEVLLSPWIPALFIENV